jgi:hypothetical protein
MGRGERLRRMRFINGVGKFPFGDNREKEMGGGGREEEVVAD